MSDEEQGAGEAKSNAATLTKEITEFIKATAWPIVTLVIFLGLFTPIRNLLSELPNVVGRADVITIGQVKVELSRALGASATTDVRDALKGLTGNSVRRLLHLSLRTLECEFRHDPVRYASDRAAHSQLQTRALVSMLESKKDDNDQRSKCYMVELTDLGKRAQDFLFSFLSASLKLDAT